MKVLLDTNALLWQIGEQKNNSLGPKSRRLLDESAAVYVSSISIVEIHIKRLLGKLQAPENMVKEIERSGNELLDYSAPSADALSLFPALAKHDPFDRMLLAQAKDQGLKFLTSDKLLIELGYDFVVDARC